MTQPNDDGPAFPGQNTGPDYNRGMSLRDWFAGQAIAGLADSERYNVPSIVQLAYGIADEALRVRMKDIEEE